MIQEFEDKKLWQKDDHVDFNVYLCQVTRTGVLRFLSHREWITAVQRTMRRAGFPFWYTRGFHPKPKFKFPRAMPTGLISRANYFLLRLNREDAADTHKLGSHFNKKAPAGMQMKGMWRVFDSFSLTGYMDLWRFRLIIRDNFSKALDLEGLLGSRAYDGKVAEMNNGLFMIEYNTEEKNWLDYRELLEKIYGERYPRQFYLPILEEVFYKEDGLKPIRKLFDAGWEV